MNYSKQNHVALLRHKIAIEAEFAKELTGQDKVDREHFMGGMKYALDLLQNPHHNGMDEVKGEYRLGDKLNLHSIIMDDLGFEEMELSIKPYKSKTMYRKDNFDIHLEVVEHNDGLS